MKKDHYTVLCIPRDASADQIKKAFHKIARLHHPDVARGSLESENIMKMANLAYETLNDPLKRSAYDHALSHALVIDLTESVDEVVTEYFATFNHHPTIPTPHDPIRNQ